MLASLTGALTLAGARDFVTLLVGLETLTLPTYALVALRRRDPAGAEAAVKYLLVSVTSTAVTLLGVALVYGAAGSLHFDRVAAALAPWRGRPRTCRSPPPPSCSSSPASPSRSRRCRSTGGRRTSTRARRCRSPPSWPPSPRPAAFVGLVLVTTVAFGPYYPVWSAALAVLAWRR